MGELNRAGRDRKGSEAIIVAVEGEVGSKRR